ncbi:MAG: BLUF domain-containing protein [Pseudomonadota bacterium]
MGGDSDLILIVYTSQPKGDLSVDDLAHLVSSARRANSANGITAALLHRDDVFVQWIEGPRHAAEPLYEKIKVDPRHTSVELLVNRPIKTRLFERWPLLLVERSAATLIAENASAPDIASAIASPFTNNNGNDLDAAAKLKPPSPSIEELGSDSALYSVITAFADSIASFEETEFEGHIERALESMNSPQGLIHLVESTGRRLGDLWARDEIDTLRLTVAVMRMHVLSRRYLWSLGPRQRSPDRSWTILVSPIPGETRAINAVLDVGVLWREGWRPRHLFPLDEADLLDALADRWYDVLDLSASGVFGVPNDILMLRRVIEKARVSSVNPNLQVVLAGRLFYENNFASKAVGADVSIGSSAEIGRAMVRAVRNLKANPSGYSEKDWN